MTTLERREIALQLMDTFVIDHVSDEDDQVIWLLEGVPDGNGIELSDYEWIAVEDEIYQDILNCFKTRFLPKYEKEFQEYIAEVTFQELF